MVTAPVLFSPAPSRRSVRSKASQGRTERRRRRRGSGIFQQENIRDLGRNARGLRLLLLAKFGRAIFVILDMEF